MGLLYSNYECNPTNNVRINAVSGTLTKTFKESYFVRFQRGSKMEERYFSEENPYRKDSLYNVKDIVILQVMLMSDDNYIVEAIDREAFDKYFKSE